MLRDNRSTGNARSWKIRGRLGSWSLLHASEVPVADQGRLLPNTSALWLVRGWLRDPSLRGPLLAMLDELDPTRPLGRARGLDIGMLSWLLTSAIEEARIAVLEDVWTPVAGIPAEPTDLPPPKPQKPATVTADWVAIRVTTDKGRPLVGARYRITLPDGGIRQGILDADGRVDIRNITSGPCDIVLPDFDASEWGVAERPTEAGTVYTIRQGDHLAAISARHGFGTSATIWSHPRNAEIASVRDPNVLFEGDEIFLPDKTTGVAFRDTGSEHAFQVVAETLYLRLRLLDPFGKPRSGVGCLIGVGGGDDYEESVSDGDGKVAREIDAMVHHAAVESAADAAEIPLLVGHLDPLGEESGYRARLYNMGYLLDPFGDDDEMRIALEDFQADQELATTGTLDAPTLAAIGAAHGS